MNDKTYMDSNLDRTLTYKDAAKRDAADWNVVSSVHVGGNGSAPRRIEQVRWVTGYKDIYVQRVAYVDGADAPVTHEIDMTPEAFDRMAKALGYVKA